MQQHVSVYLFKDKLYITPHNQTTVGLWISSEFVFTVEKGNMELLASTILEALSLSKNNVPYPADFKGLIEPLLKAAKIRSYKSFSSSAQLISVESERGLLRITPWKNLGDRKGYVPIEAREKILQQSETEKLGELILKELLEEV